MLDTQEFEQAAQLPIDILDVVDKQFIINSAEGGMMINTGLVDLVVLNVYIALMGRVPGFDPSEIAETLNSLTVMENLQEASDSLWAGVAAKREKQNANS